MQVKEVLDLARLRLKNLNASKDLGVLLSVMNIGVSDLYRRFNLRLGSETVLVHPDLSVYELRNDDVNMLLCLYDEHGRELVQGDVLNSRQCDYKVISYREFMYYPHRGGHVFAIYKASPIKLVNVEDELDLPDAMIPALLTYMCYVLEHTTNVWDRGQVKSEPSFYWQLYEKEIQVLINEGYMIPLNTETVAIQRKGFV